MKKYLNTFLITLLFGITAAFADSGTRSVDTEATLSASPDDVMQAFLDEDDLKAWWKVSRTFVEPKVGGVWSITWDDWGVEKTQHAWIGVIEKLTPTSLVIGHLVMIEPDMPLLAPMQIEINVSAAGRGTALRLSHRGYGYGDHWDKMYELVVNGWDHVLGDMEAWFQEGY